MKKVSGIIAVLLVVALALTACAGGGGSSQGALSGTYKLSSAVVGGQEMTIEELQSNPSMESLTDLLDMSFTFSGSNNVSMNIAGQSVDTTYTLNGETLTIDDGAIEGTYQDDKITIEQSGITLIFAK